MAEKATINMHLQYRKDQANFVTRKVELVGVPWYIRYSSNVKRNGVWGFKLENAKVQFTPVDVSKTLIWNCEAVAKFMAFPARPNAQWSKLFPHSYDFRNLRSTPVDIDFNDLSPENNEFRNWNPDLLSKKEKSSLTMDVQLSVFGCKMIDLADRNNAMIKSSDDAAQVKVEGETLWVSKSVLSANSHFFKAFFNSKFEEQRTGVYELKEIDLKQFLHFVALLYRFQVRMDGDSVEYLLRLADYFQSDVVTDRCRDCFFHSEELCCVKNLKLADRYGFFEIVAKVAGKMTAVDLKNCVRAGGLSTTTCEIMAGREWM